MPEPDKEYGWITPEERKNNGIKAKNEMRLEVAGEWQAISVGEKMPDIYWQYGYSEYSYRGNLDDRFTNLLDDEKVEELVTPMRRR